jgi:hypothetical protein
MKLKALKTYHTIKVGGSERSFFTSNDYELELDPKTSLIYIQKGEDKVLTSLSNMVWSKELEDEPEQAKKNPPRKAEKAAPKGKAKLAKQRISKAK